MLVQTAMDKNQDDYEINKDTTFFLIRVNNIKNQLIIEV